MPQNPPGGPAGDPNDPKKISIIGKVPTEYDPVALKDIGDAIREQTTAQQNAGNTSNDVPNMALHQQTRANEIAIWALILGGASVVATIVVILLNYKAINVANKSANVADSALEANQKQFKIEID